MNKAPTFTKITDYLFETTYTDYEGAYEDAVAYYRKYNPKLGGCSSVQNGTIRGRNYDWTYDEEPEFIVHVPANDKGRHASLGVVATSAMTAADVENGVDAPFLKFLPYSTLDGINDAGLCVNINVVGYEEMGEYVMKTEDTSDDVCPLMVCRLLLDNCGSIDESLALLDTMDIFSLGTQEECHLMISGPQSAEDSTFNTVVVELIPDENKHYQLSVIDYNKGDFVDNKPIMTNFHLTGFDGTVESATRHPMGFERWQILYEAYDQGSTVRGMMDLMKKVYYTRCYDLYSDRAWYSEFASGDLDMTMVGAEKLNGDVSAAGAYAQAFRNAADSYASLDRNASTWHTVHTSVYDTEAKVLYILPQEAGYAYRFALEQ